MFRGRKNQNNGASNIFSFLQGFELVLLFPVRGKLVFVSQGYTFGYFSQLL